MGQSVSSQIIETIANFYEDSNSALKLLRRYTKKGNILLPEEIMPLEDFYRLERSAWEKRKKYSVDHSNAILERHFRNENTHRESFFGGSESREIWMTSNEDAIGTASTKENMGNIPRNRRQNSTSRRD